MTGRPTENKAPNSRNTKYPQEKKGVVLAAGEPMMPPGMSKDEQYYWNFYIALFKNQGILTQLDGESLYKLCMELDLRDYFYKEVKKLRKSDKLIYQTCNGSYATHPAVKELKDVNKAIAASCRILGLDPLNRSSIKPAKQKKSSGKKRVSLKSK